MSRKTDLTLIDQDDGTTTVAVKTEKATAFTMHLDPQPAPPPTAPEWPDQRQEVQDLQAANADLHRALDNMRDSLERDRAKYETELAHERAKANRRKKAAARNGR
jgi:phage/plasmid primase-like uncharacterized protein